MLYLAAQLWLHRVQAAAAGVVIFSCCGYCAVAAAAEAVAS